MAKDWLNIPAIPNINVTIADINGRPNRDWYLWAQRIDLAVRELQQVALNDLADVDAASPGNAEVLTWIAANSNWEPS